MECVVCQSVDINWKAFVGSWILRLTMLVKQSGAEVVKCHPDLVLNLVFTCLCSSFIDAAVPSSSVTVVFAPFSQWAFQFAIECSEQFDESCPLFLTSSAWGCFFQNIG